MDFSFTDEQQAVGDLAAQILDDRVTHESLRELERSSDPRFDRDTWSAVAEAGLLGIALPESAGGAGLGLVELARILEVVGRTAAALPVWETVALGAMPIAEFGSAELQADWLPKVADGSAVLTAAWHEDDGDPAQILTTATTTGGGVSVTGTKICVPSAQIADAFVVPAIIDGTPGLVLVEPGTGVTVEAIVTTGGAPDGGLILDGAPGIVISTGAESLLWARQRAVATQCALSLGNVEKMVELIASYTKERKQFDVPIAMFQAVGHRAADCYIDAEAIRLTTWQAVTRLAEDLEASDEVAVAKFWSAWGGQRISLAAAHLHGGVGVDRDYPLARHFTRAKELELQLGGATQSLLSVGRALAAT
jgi:3-oxocholest-4-en-26-oyl-CoA dehydrogenase beta subunit